MRWFSQLFAVYLFVLAFLPCSDTYIQFATSTSYIAAVALENGDREQDHGDHEDHCTPFCICACCGAMLDAPPVAPTLTERDPLPPCGKTAPVYTPNWSPGLYAGDDWQPPRA